MRNRIIAKSSDFNSENFITRQVYNRIGYHGFFIKRELVLQWCAEIFNRGKIGKKDIIKFVDLKIACLYFQVATL